MKIKKAILPVAGMGTRFLPATKAQPKEMLPIFDTPAIQLIIEEAVDAGIEEIIIITGRGKQAIENHFDDHFELSHILQKKGKQEELEMVNKISKLANLIYLRQPQPMGDGHALLQAKNLINPDESVVVLFGDDIVDNPNGKSSIKQLIELWEAVQTSVLLLQEVDKNETDKYGIVKYGKKGEGFGQIHDFVEKPHPDEAPSDLAVVGKFILTPEMFHFLEKAQPGKDGEIRLADAFIHYLDKGGRLHGKVLEGLRFDTGDKMGYLDATLHYAMKQDPKGVKRLLENFGRKHL